MHSFHSLLSLVLSTFLLLFSYSKAQHLHAREQHHDVRHRRTNNLYNTFSAKHKRDTFTYFADGQGACGATNGPTDFIVALNAAQFDGGAHCFEMITITVNGKTAPAQIVDECVGCSEYGLDLSQGLFEYFAPLDQGELQGTWSYNSGATTSSPTPTPSTTSYAPTPTTTVTTTAAAATTATTTTNTSLASTIVSSTSTATSVAPTSAPQNLQMIAEINLVLLELGMLLGASFKLSG